MSVAGSSHGKHSANSNGDPLELTMKTGIADLPIKNVD